MATDDDALTARLGVESLMVANTSQLRQLAGNARRWNLPYQLDFRLNTMLDQRGLHSVLFDEIYSSDSDFGTTEWGTKLFVRGLVFCKVVGVGPEKPVASYLSLRFRDYIWLQPPGDARAPRRLAQARFLLERDEFSPGDPDPTVVGVIAAVPHPGADSEPRFLGYVDGHTTRERASRLERR